MLLLHYIGCIFIYTSPELTMKVLELFFLKICLLSALGLCEKLFLRFHFFTYAKFMIKDKKGSTSNYSVIFFCVAKGESRSRSAVTPSVRLFVRPSSPKSCHRNSSETTDPIIMKRGM